MTNKVNPDKAVKVQPPIAAGAVVTEVSAQKAEIGGIRTELPDGTVIFQRTEVVE